MLLASRPVVLVESPRVPSNHLKVVLMESLQFLLSQLVNLLASHKVLSNHLVMLVESPRVPPNRLVELMESLLVPLSRLVMHLASHQALPNHLVELMGSLQFLLSRLVMHLASHQALAESPQAPLSLSLLSQRFLKNATLMTLACDTSVKYLCLKNASIITWNRINRSMN